MHPLAKLKYLRRDLAHSRQYRAMSLYPVFYLLQTTYPGGLYLAFLYSDDKNVNGYLKRKEKVIRKRAALLRREK